MDKKNIKGFIFNVAYNLIATAVPLAILQIFLLPLVSRYISDEAYGLAVTIIALLNICPGVLGMAINNVRLLNDKGISDNPHRYNFPRILREICLLNVFVMLIITIIYEGTFNLSVVLTVFLSVLWLLREYLIVEYQIKLSYRNILINNVLLSVGYLIGFVFFYFSHYWQFIYITGYLIALFDLYKKGFIFTEPFVRTKLLNTYRKDTFFLSFSAVLTRITTYADRLILYPVLGGRQVSIYYAASIMAKLISMIISPITSVFLAYLSKIKKKPKKAFNIAFALSIVLCIVGYFLIIWSSNFVLSILYPEYVQEAVVLVPYTALSTILYVLITILNPLILKFFDMKWQVFINGINVILYLVISFICLNMGGIKMFCIGTAIVNFVKLITMLILYYGGKTKAEFTE